MSEFTKKKYLTLGVIQKDRPFPDDPADAPQRVSLKLEQQKNKKTGELYGDQLFPLVLANGMVVNDGTYLKLFPKQPKIQQMVEEGKMSQEDADKLGFLLFDVCLVVPDTQAAPAPKKKKTEVPF